MVASSLDMYDRFQFSCLEVWVVRRSILNTRIKSAYEATISASGGSAFSHIGIEGVTALSPDGGAKRCRNKLKGKTVWRWTIVRKISRWLYQRWRKVEMIDIIKLTNPFMGHNAKLIMIGSMVELGMLFRRRLRDPSLRSTVNPQIAETLRNGIDVK